MCAARNLTTGAATPFAHKAIGVVVVAGQPVIVGQTQPRCLARRQEPRTDRGAVGENRLEAIAHLRVGEEAARDLRQFADFESRKRRALVPPRSSRGNLQSWMTGASPHE